MNLQLNTSIPLITVFVQGILSFLSPCVLPLVPVYLGYLAGGGYKNEEGKMEYPRKQAIIHSFFFVLGLSFTFYLLGFGFTVFGEMLSNYRDIFAKASGVIMILFGLYQLGVFGTSMAVEKEHRFHFAFDKWTINPIVAFLLGFTFSFAWTPCVGPILGSVVLMAGSSGEMLKSFGLITVYVLGFGIPFLLVGTFTGTVLEFLQKRKGIMKYTVKAAAFLILFMGIITFSGLLNQTVGNEMNQNDSSTSQKVSEENQQEQNEKQDQNEEQDLTPVPDFTFHDQYGEEHSISDYRGKVVFMNFWATWCPPCKAELPDIQDLYEKYGANEKDVVVLGIAGPKVGQEGDEEHIRSFLEENEYTFPVLMNEGGSLFQTFGVQAFPTTYMITADGDIYGQVTGGLTAEMMENIVQQTLKDN